MARRMRFGTWCKKDPEDTTLIAYTFKAREYDGTEKTYYFTSDDIASYALLERVRNAWIESIERVTNELTDQWNVVLYEDR